MGPKGGPGKSTVGRAVTVGIIGAGATAGIADLDPQKTCVDWAIKRENLREDLRRRGKEVPHPVPVRYFANLSEALNESARYDFHVLDAPGKTGPEMLAIAQAADVVVMPCNPGADDMWPTIKAYNELVRKGVPKSKLIMVLNHVGGAPEEKAARTFLAEECAAQVLDVGLREKVVYRSAMTAGLSITEVKGEGLRKEAEAVVSALIDKILAIHGAGNGSEEQGRAAHAAA